MEMNVLRDGSQVHGSHTEARRERARARNYVQNTSNIITIIVNKWHTRTHSHSIHHLFSSLIDSIPFRISIVALKSLMPSSLQWQSENSRKEGATTTYNMRKEYCAMQYTHFNALAKKKTFSSVHE